MAKVTSYQQAFVDDGGTNVVANTVQGRLNRAVMRGAAVVKVREDSADASDNADDEHIDQDEDEISYDEDEDAWEGYDDDEEYEASVEGGVQIKQEE